MLGRSLVAGLAALVVVPAALAGAAPANTVPPAITGTFDVGKTITVSSGTWSGSPTSYLYQFVRCAAICNPTGGYTPIAAASSTATYKLTVADAGHQLYALVQATNSSGNTVATAFPTPIVAAANGGSTTAANTTTAQTTTTTSKPVPPKAVFTFSRKSALTESFNATASLAKRPALGLGRYNWSYGDGKTDTGSKVVHKFAKAGTYTVKLTVIDNLGHSASVKHAVHVR